MPFFSLGKTSNQKTSIVLTVFAFLGAVLVSLFVSACGGSSGTSATVTSSIYSGPVSGLGSIVVNGVRFDTVGVSTSDADDLYGSTEASHALDLGITVAVDGSVNSQTLTGAPYKIRVIGGVRGNLVATPTANPSSIQTQNGQPIYLSTSTIYGGTSSRGLVSSSADLQAGDPIEAYGLINTDGNFLATRVRALSTLASYPNQLAIRGVIESIASSASMVVQVASGMSLTVTCPSSSCSVAPQGSVLAIGTPVRILAASSSSLVGGVLSANKVQDLSLSALASSSGLSPRSIKAKGFPQNIGGNWYLEGARVSASFAASTQALTLEGGFSDDARQYFSGTHAEYEGDHYVTDGSGVRLPYLNEFYGPVANLSGSTFTVQGMSVNATGAYISGGTLQNGAYAEVKGSLVGNVIQAVRIEIKSGSSLTGNVGRFEIKGVVSSWAATSKTFVLTGAGGGVWTVDANSAYFEHGYPNNGNWVEIKAYIGTGNILVASKVEVKNNGWDD